MKCSPGVAPEIKSNNEHNFTKSFLDAIKPAATGKRVLVYDTIRPELAIRVTDRGTKSFVIQKRLNEKIIKITLGKYPAMSIAQAREETLRQLNLISKGVNPNEEKKQIKQEMTFGTLFEEYMDRYSKPQKKSWMYDAREIPYFLSPWFKRALSTITKQDIQKLHEKIKKTNGLYQANRILERLKGMYNKAIEWGYPGANPANGIKKFKEVKRDRFLKPDELPLFFESIELSSNAQIKNFIYLSLLTGARKSNLLSMRWKDIDFHNALWRIPETKNGEPFVASLPCQAMEILNDLRENNNDDWVFPSKTSKSGHLEEPKKAFKAICRAAGVGDLRIHDLRRTFASYQAIQGSSMLIIAKSVGHKDMKSTEIYSRLTQDPIRESVNKATSTIWRLGNENK